MLDILTPAGQKTLADEQVVAQSFTRQTGILYVQTPKDAPATCDALLIKDGILVGMAETKCRYDIPDMEFWRQKYKSEWLITWRKVTRNCDLADGLCVPLVGILYIVQPKIFLVKRIYDGRNKHWVAKLRTERSVTQAGVNGGSADRMNVFVDMRDAKQYAL